jgi:uncharacterized protein
MVNKKMILSKMRVPVLIVLSAFFSVSVNAQKTYADSIAVYQKEYVNTHGVVKGYDTSNLSFYPVKESNRVIASFEKKDNAPWFNMVTSGNSRPLYRIYGTIYFTLNGQQHKLNLYQSQSLMEVDAYKSHLFLPFTDETSGNGSYEGGRYIDLSFEDIRDKKILIDFNKAYNPYCAYVSGKYNCPIPPAENTLPVRVEAGERQYAKH